MFTQDRKYFRFPLQFIAVVSLASSLVCSTQEISVQPCVEAAIYVKNRMSESITIDQKLLRNIINCAKELHRLYKTADWKAIQKMLPQEVKDVIREVPHLGRKALASARGSEGLCFVSVYLLYRAIDLCDRAMSLDMDYKMHKKEFEWLQMELQPVIALIHDELLPQWEYLSTPALRKVTADVTVKLSHFHAELKHLVRVIHNDTKKGLSGRRWAAALTVGSLAALVPSALIGNIPGAVASSVASVSSFAGYVSLTVTVRKLASLQNEVEMMCNETEEYRFLLERKLIRGMLLEISYDFFMFLSVVSVFVWLQRGKNHQRDEQERDGREHGENPRYAREHNEHEEREENARNGRPLGENGPDGQGEDDYGRDEQIRQEHLRENYRQDGQERDEQIRDE